jgi:hypothetical protein
MLWRLAADGARSASSDRIAAPPGQRSCGVRQWHSQAGAIVLSSVDPSAARRQATRRTTTLGRGRCSRPRSPCRARRAAGQPLRPLGAYFWASPKSTRVRGGLACARLKRSKTRFGEIEKHGQKWEVRPGAPPGHRCGGNGCATAARRGHRCPAALIPARSAAGALQATAPGRGRGSHRTRKGNRKVSNRG